MVVKLFKKTENGKELINKKTVIKTSQGFDGDIVYHLNNYFFEPFIADMVYGKRIDNWITLDGNDYLFTLEK